MNEHLLDTAKTVLSEMLEKLGAPVEINAISDSEEPKLDLKSAHAGRLIGRKGQNLESLELVMNRIIRREQADEESTPWVVLEVDGYSVPHKAPEHHGRVSHAEMEQLQAMALDIAKEVKYWGEAKVIGPYRPAERRIIHMTLRNDPQVETVSDAEADANGYKRITVQMIKKEAKEE